MLRPSRQQLVVLAAAVAAFAVAQPAAAKDARALDSQGRVLTVGPFMLLTTDGGVVLRVEDQSVLSWELHDQDVLLGYGVVPGSEGPGLDAAPALSRDPANERTWLVWSRQANPGQARDIPLIAFDDGPDASSFRVLASSTCDQVDPAIIHDEGGWTYVAWIDEASNRQVKALSLSPTGVLLPERTLSTGLSDHNSAPQLGIDATGMLFTAYIGRSFESGVSQLYVQAPAAYGGGVKHLPNPLIELGLQAELPTPAVLDPPAPGESGTIVHLTVLGGTPVAWWQEWSPENHLLFRYVAQELEGWPASAVKTIDLSTGTLGTIPEALELLEARLRRVVASPVATEPGQPGLPGFPGRLAPIGRRE